MSVTTSSSYNYIDPYVDHACEVVKVVCKDTDYINSNSSISEYCEDALAGQCAPYDPPTYPTDQTNPPTYPTDQNNPTSNDYIPTSEYQSTTSTTQEPMDEPMYTTEYQPPMDELPTYEPMKEEESIKLLEDKGYTIIPPTDIPPTDIPSTEPFTVREGFSNKAAYGKKLLQLDLFLRALLYGCLFFLLAHPDTRSLLMKFVSKKNLMYVVPVIFALAYYVLNLYI